MPPEQIVLPVNCFACGGPLEIACEVIPDLSSAQTVRFACPYCGTSREYSAPGRVVYVAIPKEQAGPN